MGRSMIRMLSVVLLAIGVFSAIALPSAARDVRCPATTATYELQMGPGGDFAGATVVRVERADPASTGILQMGPGGDFAGATVIEPARARTPVILSRRSRRKIHDACTCYASAAKDGRRTPYFVRVVLKPL